MQIDIRSGNSTYHFHFCNNLPLTPFVLPDIEERKKRRKKGDVFENEAKPRAWLCGDELSRRWGNVTSQPVSTKQSSCQSSKKFDHVWNTIWRFVLSPLSKLAQISSRSRTMLHVIFQGGATFINFFPMCCRSTVIPLVFVDQSSELIWRCLLKNEQF